jgi:predicted ATPase
MFGLSHVARTLWLLGYPDQARQRGEEALAHARTLAHPYSLLHALNDSVILQMGLRNEATAWEQAEAALQLATEQGAMQLVALGIFNQGLCRLGQGQIAEGRMQVQQGLAAYRATGARARLPYYLARLAEACLRVGQPEASLTAVAEALAQVEATGERWWEAELHRLRGQLLSGQRNTRAQTEGTRRHLVEAEPCFQQALEIARRQEAKSLELRAAMSLSRLWQQQGKDQQAYDLLAPVYDWFTEGFDTLDLQEAKTLLAELA